MLILYRVLRRKSREFREYLW